ncbi:hypothetical protein MPER_04516 [Moniliophthora perniciosa FA553]|nr:hypothetical protein MPER_04516 [Moniliophthora perniciosa FA553]
MSASPASLKDQGLHSYEGVSPPKAVLLKAVEHSGNDLTLPCGLAIELWTRIWLECLATKELEYNVNVTRLQLVCKAWYFGIRDNRILWTSITIAHFETNHVRLLKRVIQKSAPYPLSFRLQARDSTVRHNVELALQTLEGVCYRWLKAEFHLDGSQQRLPALSYFLSNDNILQVFRLFG